MNGYDCDNCKSLLDYDKCPICDNGSKFERITNAVKIRRMSDEELAEFLCCVYDEEECFGKFINGIVIQNYDEDRIAEWLKSEVKE